MIEFKNFPPREPGDVVLTDLGLQALHDAARARAVVPGDQPLFRVSGAETGSQISERLHLIGSTIGSVIAEAVEGPVTLEALAITGHIAAQFRATLNQPDEKWQGQVFGASLLGAMNEYNVVSELRKEGVTA